MTQTIPVARPSAVLAPVTDLPPQGPATVRTAVTVPLRFPDGWTTTARVVTFDGLADGLEHLALALGDREGRSPAVPQAARPRSCARTASAQLERAGVEVSERVQTAGHLSSSNARYLTAKVVRTAHTLDLPFAG